MKFSERRENQPFKLLVKVDLVTTALSYLRQTKESHRAMDSAMSLQALALLDGEERLRAMVVVGSV
jgi:hypothetical protein